MTTETKMASRSHVGRYAGIAFVVALVVAMALDTHVVVIDSEEDVRTDAFSPETYGGEMFPEIQSFVETRAESAVRLHAAIEEDKDAAVAQYGVEAGIGAVMPVKFTGTAGEARAGVYTVEIEELDDVTVRVQTGPAINGTDLRDAMGTIEFGQFKNQIEYQNAAAGINDAMKVAVLDGVDTGELTGETIAVTGVFKLISPSNWLVTPVRMSVE